MYIPVYDFILFFVAVQRFLAKCAGRRKGQRTNDLCRSKLAFFVKVLDV